MKRTKKTAMAVVLGAALAANLSVTAFAVDDTVSMDDILSIDGKTGKIFLEADPDGMNYPLKYLYDINFWYPQDASTKNPTLGRVIEFLSTGRQEGFSARVDLNKFVNSDLGAKTAEIWYPHMLYEDQMDEGLLAYWANLGLQKEAYYIEDTDYEGITADFFVYTPTKAEQPENGYPLVILNHGGGEAAYQTETFGFCEVAAEEGIILAAGEEWTDDAGIINYVTENYPVDASRIYVVGSSGGGNASLQYAMSNVTQIAGVAIMDQPVSLATRWYAAEEEQIADIQEHGLAMTWVGGTADMYGLHGITSADSRGQMSTEFFETSEGAEEQFISGWNALMTAYGIEGKEITSRLDFLENPANKAEELDGYPFDVVEDIDVTGTVPTYKCTMNGTDDICLFLVENRAHMPAGHDAENIWSFLSGYSRNTETLALEKAE